MVNCRVCGDEGSSEDDAVNTADGCDCGWIHRYCGKHCDGCGFWWCEDHVEDWCEIQGRDYCYDCCEGMKDAIGDHRAAGAEHDQWNEERG